MKLRVAIEGKHVDLSQADDSIVWEVLDRLDVVATRIGVTALREFCDLSEMAASVLSEEEMDELHIAMPSRWHPPEDVLATVHGLITELRRGGDVEPKVPLQADVLKELKELERPLRLAEYQGRRVRLRAVAWD